MKILLIQTAFTGDVILATALAESLHAAAPSAQMDFLVRKGNEGLLAGHPFLKRVLVFDKNKGKAGELFRLIAMIRKERYDVVVNAHRFASSGMIAAFSGAKEISGFDKNPFSSFFTRSYSHIIGNGTHETERNHQLIAWLSGPEVSKPRLYPTSADYEKVRTLQSAPYVCIAPSSVWFTKQLPVEKWVELTDQLKQSRRKIFLVGAPGEKSHCEIIRAASSNENISNIAGAVTLLEAAALMAGAEMNYTNDSAPLHIASAMNAPVTAVFCSTVPEFGFGPLSDNRFIIQAKESLPCRPCGLHGHRKCPQGHFKCAQVSF